MNYDPNNYGQHQPNYPYAASNDQTVAGYPTYQNQWQQPPPYQPSSYPPTPPPVEQSWFKRQRRRTKFGIVGVGSLIGVLFLCILCSVVGNALPKPPSTGNNQNTVAIAASPTNDAQSSNAPTTTSQPIQLPTSTPTVSSAPSPTPVQQVRQPQPTSVQVQPTPTSAPPPPPPPPPPPACNGTVMGGACYNTDSVGGSVVTITPPGFCGYFRCIGNFPNGTGWIVECGDGQWSHSGGKSGTCSKNGGVIATLYKH